MKQIKFQKLSNSMWDVFANDHRIGMMRRTSMGYIVLRGKQPLHEAIRHEGMVLTNWLRTQKEVKEELIDLLDWAALPAVEEK